MIAILFLTMVAIDRRSFLPRPWLPPAFVVLGFVAMVAEGLQ